MNGNADRSTLVTTLAWVLIVFAGFTTLISVLQNIMINLMFPVHQMAESLKNASPHDMPAGVKFLFSSIRFFFFVVLVVSVAGLVSAIGLIRKKNWARIIFMAFFVLGIAWNCFGVVFQFT